MVFWINFLDLLELKIMSEFSDYYENNLSKSFDQKNCDKTKEDLKMSSENPIRNQSQKSIFEVTDSDIDEEMAKDNNNLQNETIDGFDFDTPEEFLLYHSRTGNLKVVEKLILLAKKNEIELDLNCKGIDCVQPSYDNPLFQYSGKSKSNYGWSPLHLAAYFGHYKVVEELIKVIMNTIPLQLYL